MFFSYDFLAQHIHRVLENRLSKTLPPDLRLQVLDHIGAHILRWQTAIGGQGLRQGGSVQPLHSNVLQGQLERGQVVFHQRAACGHGVTAKTQQ